MESTRKIPIGEVVLSVMALASKKGQIKKFPYPFVFSAFQKIAEENPDFFPGLYFTYLSGGIPHSRRLENILFRLGAWEGISVENPHFHYLQVNKKVVSSIEEDIKTRFGPDSLTALEKMGDEFKSLLPESEYEF